MTTEQAVNISLDDVLSASSKKAGTGVMSAYKRNLIHIMKQIADPANAERVPKLTIEGKSCPAMAVGKVVNSLKQLFDGGDMSNWSDQQRYNRSYRYLKGFVDQNTLRNLGIEVVDVEGDKKHLVVIDAEKLTGTGTVTTATAKGKKKGAAPETAEPIQETPASATDLA